MADAARHVVPAVAFPAPCLPALQAGEPISILPALQVQVPDAEPSCVRAPDGSGGAGGHCASSHAATSLPFCLRRRGANNRRQASGGSCLVHIKSCRLPPFPAQITFCPVHIALLQVLAQQIAQYQASNAQVTDGIDTTTASGGLPSLREEAAAAGSSGAEGGANRGRRQHCALRGMRAPTARRRPARGWQWHETPLGR